MKTYAKLSDVELAGLLKTGDEKAFAEIFVRYNALILNFAYKKTSDKELSKDLMQDVFVQLWKHRLNFELKPSLSSYLFTMILNLVRNIYKHQQVKERYVDYLHQIMKEADEAGMADYAIREKDFQQLIDKEIEALPPQSRQVFILRKKAFLTNKEVALQMGLSEQTVETHMKNAVKKLKDRLGPTVYLVLPFFL